MKTFVGNCMMCIGAKLWEKGGWTGDETYDDLSFVGKVGFNLLTEGCVLMGVTNPDVIKH